MIFIISDSKNNNEKEVEENLNQNIPKVTIEKNCSFIFFNKKLNLIQDFIKN